MVSTASDYVRFAQMLLNGGELDQVRLLSPRTVSFMTSDHLWPGVSFSPVTLNLFEPLGIAPTPKVGQGFGLGFVVRTQKGATRRQDLQENTSGLAYGARRFGWIPRRS